MSDEFTTDDILIQVTWKFIWKLIRNREMAVRIRYRGRIDIASLYVLAPPESIE